MLPAFSSALQLPNHLTKQILFFFPPQAGLPLLSEVAWLQRPKQQFNRVGEIQSPLTFPHPAAFPPFAFERAVWPAHQQCASLANYPSTKGTAVPNSQMRMTNWVD